MNRPNSINKAYIDQKLTLFSALSQELTMDDEVDDSVEAAADVEAVAPK